MTKNTLLFYFFLLNSFIVIGQNDQIINGGFEDWPSTLLIETPDDWLALAIDNISLTTKNTDAIDQDFSANIRSEEINGEVEIGILILGSQSVDDPDEVLGIPYTAEVDSLIAWVKYDIQPGDSATIITSQQINGSDIISLRHLKGQQDDWTRIAMALNASAQDSLVVAFSSSDLILEEGLAGSWLRVDGIELVRAGSTPPALPNASFENWTEITFSNPDGWGSLNPALSLLGLAPNVTPSTDSHSGNLAAQLEVTAFVGDTVPALLVYGDPTDDFEQSGVPYTGTPSSFKGWYKYQPSGTDTAAIFITFLKEQAIIGVQLVVITGENSDYVPFDLPLTLLQFPDTVQLIVSAGSNPGSRLLIDDFSFDGVISTQEAPIFKSLQLAPNPAREVVRVNHPEAAEPFEMRLYSAQGQLLDRRKSASGTAGEVAFPLHNYPSGFYIMEIRNGNERAVRKVVKE